MYRIGRRSVFILYIKNDVVFRVFTLELTTKEPIFIDQSLYEDIRDLLKEHLNAYVPIVYDNHRHYKGNDCMHYFFDIHVGSSDTPEEVRLNKVELILGEIMIRHKIYSSYKVSIN